MTQRMEVSYYCALCKADRYVKLDPEYFEASVKASPNGLVEVSDIHRCRNGLLILNNLHVDHNLAVRSYSIMELPEARQAQMAVPGLPMPGKGKNFNIYNINKMLPEGGYRLVYTDTDLRIKLKIGNIRDGEQIVEKIQSDAGSVAIDYYPSEIDLTPAIREWLRVLLKLLENLPPTRLGLFIDTIRFVYHNHGSAPSEFQIKELQALLSWHIVRLDIASRDEDRVAEIAENLETIDKKDLINILDLVTENPNIRLFDVQSEFGDNLIELIDACLQLEQEGIITINRDHV